MCLEKSITTGIPAIFREKKFKDDDKYLTDNGENNGEINNFTSIIIALEIINNTSETSFEFLKVNQ